MSSINKENNVASISVPSDLNASMAASKAKDGKPLANGNDSGAKKKSVASKVKIKKEKKAKATKTKRMKPQVRCPDCHKAPCKFQEVIARAKAGSKVNWSDVYPGHYKNPQRRKRFYWRCENVSQEDDNLPGIKFKAVPRCVHVYANNLFSDVASEAAKKGNKVLAPSTSEDRKCLQ
mmetsp:Transcript_102227/g.153141  ORF Transcript_102227/g.153141 Transcript_102227/m.153141 type:complete len:177 (+) Transcript_102227:293-823(+)